QSPLPLPPPTSTLFPYTTLFRSGVQRKILRQIGDHREALRGKLPPPAPQVIERVDVVLGQLRPAAILERTLVRLVAVAPDRHVGDRKSTRLNSSHVSISYAVFCL